MNYFLVTFGHQSDFWASSDRQKVMYKSPLCKLDMFCGLKKLDTIDQNKFSKFYSPQINCNMFERTHLMFITSHIDSTHEHTKGTNILKAWTYWSHFMPLIFFSGLGDCDATGLGRQVWIYFLLWHGSWHLGPRWHIERDSPSTQTWSLFLYDGK